jgi:hypothetical protein
MMRFHNLLVGGFGDLGIWGIPARANDAFLLQAQSVRMGCVTTQSVVAYCPPKVVLQVFQSVLSATI